MPAPQISNEVRTERLDRGQEYRFEVDFNIQIDISLKQGHAEIFGTEITIGPVYSFTGTKGAVYTWLGCELEIRGTPANRLRTESGGPRVLVVGPDDSGKTSLIKILSAYALKLDRNPLLVNLDPREGMSTIPGSLSAMPMTHMLDVSDGFGDSNTTGPTDLPPKTPISYNFGALNPSTNVKYYKHLLSRLALAVNSRLSLNPAERTAGMLIDTAGQIDQSIGYDLINACITELEVTVIISLGSERLSQDLMKRYAGKRATDAQGTAIRVLTLPKSGGCVGRDVKFMGDLQKGQIRRYFHGSRTPSTSGSGRALNPFSITSSFDDLTFYRIDDAAGGVNMSLMPIGSEVVNAKIFVGEVEASSLLVNTVIAITYADARESAEAVGESNVLGYILVTDVDDEKRRMTILAPFQGRVPANALLVTGLRYSDD